MTAHPLGVELRGIRVQNLRGYGDARLSIGPLRVLVGDNNQGKSGLLRLTSWLLNEAPDDLLSQQRPMTTEEASFLLPANQTAGRARRLTLHVGLNDLRHVRRYGGHSVDLRVSFQKQPALARLNVGPPRRDESHDAEALSLLQLIRRKVHLLLVPSVRDGASTRFADSWSRTLSRVFLDRFRQEVPGGTAAEYRAARRFLQQIERMLTDVTRTLETDLLESLPPGMLRAMSLRLNATPADLSQWLGSRVALRLCTGDHDSEHVAPSEVGNGLQSLLDVSLGLAEHLGRASGGQVVVAVEEPEAFLHPSAQREMAATLKKLSGAAHRSVLITTHSPYFVDEAEYGDIVLVRDHTFYEASSVEDRQRTDINTALMSTEAAEVFFSGGVLLVEGPGEVAFFKTLLKRIRRQSNEPRLSRLTVMEVGGKQRFAPWWRLIRSYGKEGDRPIRSLSLFDADAASPGDGERAVIRALREAGLTIGQETRTRIETFGSLGWADVQAREQQARSLNRELAASGVCFFSIDLEWATFGAVAAANPDLVASIAEAPPGHDMSPVALAKRLGSKVGTGRSDRRLKKPHLRQQLAQRIPLTALPHEVTDVLRRWVGLAGLTEAEQRGLLA